MIKHLSFTDMYAGRPVRAAVTRVVGVMLCALLVSGCATLQPNVDPRPIREQARRAYEASNYERAVEHYVDYLQQRPEDAQAWYRLGNAQAQLGRLEAAESALRQALALNSKMDRARHNLGLVQIQLGVMAILEARRGLPDVDQPAARTMEYLACLMETFMGYPQPRTCEPEYSGEDDDGPE